MKAWRIARKDLTLLLRDRRALFTLLAMPLVFITILGMSTGQMLGWRNENEELKIAVVNNDPSEWAKTLVARLSDHEGLSVSPEADAATARQMVHDGDLTAAVIITKEFSDKVYDLRVGQVLNADDGVLAGPLSDIGIELDCPPSMVNAGALVELIVRGAVFRTVLPIALKKNALLGRFVPEMTPKADQSKAAPQASASRRLVSGYGSIVYQKVVPAYTVMFMYFLITIMAGSFIVERELGTLRRLRTLPVGNGSLLLGKTIPFALISVTQGMILFVAGRALFGMSWGPQPGMLIPVIVATSCAATGLGLLTATLVRTDAQVHSLGTLVVLTMAGISGCFMPRDWLPEAMRQISLVTPHAWSLIAFDELLSTTVPNLFRVWQACGVLTGFAAVALLLGWWRFRTVA